MNIQVTNGPSSISAARSESAVAIDPNNHQRMVAASKRFRNLDKYNFTIATAYSIDGGQTWRQSLDPPLLPEWTGTTDPALAWDDIGNVFLIGLAFNNPPADDGIGLYAYISTDGGASWGPPKLIHASPGDDKQWVAADNGRDSPFRGNVYAAWDAGSGGGGGGGILFARTLDHGASWIGTANQPPGIQVNESPGSGFPEINVAPDGTVYIVARTETDITMFVSTDGGDSFHSAMSPAKGITSLKPNRYDYHVFPPGNFRVLTLPTASAGPRGKVVAAWADYRDGASRIYYALSTDGGASWPTGGSGSPTVPKTWPKDQHHFHPQIVIDSHGRVGCAFYEFGPKGVGPMGPAHLIDVHFIFLDEGETVFHRSILTDHPWNPAFAAPLSHGKEDLTFIGDYFGLDASPMGFYVVWTDTRTGTQELFADVFYRPFTFVPVYRQGDPARGIGDFDLLSPLDHAFAFDYDSSGKQDHLVLYRPGTGAISILALRGGDFRTVYSQPDPGLGIGDFDLQSPADRAFAFDYDSSGKRDHLVLYRPGTGAIAIVAAHRNGGFRTVYPQPGSGPGIGDFDLRSPADRGFAFDYDGSGKQDHLVFYRPGTGAIAIIAAHRNGGGRTVYSRPDPGPGIGIYDLQSPDDRVFAFDYDGSGKQDHLVLYRPGTGGISILAHKDGGFPSVYSTPSPPSPGIGIGQYNLRSVFDRGFAFDFDSGGKRNYLVFYRPGNDHRFWIIRRGGHFAPVFQEPTIGGYDLASPADRAFGCDYNSTGTQDHLVLFRPGSGMISILKKVL